MQKQQQQQRQQHHGRRQSKPSSSQQQQQQGPTYAPSLLVNMYNDERIKTTLFQPNLRKFQKHFLN
jgi:hypothetical protein